MYGMCECVCMTYILYCVACVVCMACDYGYICMCCVYVSMCICMYVHVVLHFIVLYHFVLIALLYMCIVLEMGQQGSFGHNRIVGVCTK